MPYRLVSKIPAGPPGGVPRDPNVRVEMEHFDSFDSALVG
jgi:hypothetical protein